MRRIFRKLGGIFLQSTSLRSLCTRADVDVCCNGEERPLRVTLIEGEGSGPAVCMAVRKIFKAADVQVEWDRHTLYMHRDPYVGRQVLNPNVVQSAIDTGLVLYGSSSTSLMDKEGMVSSTSLTLHKMLNASVGVRVFSSIDGYEPFGPVRIVNIRDNVSGEYSEIEHIVVPGNYNIIISSYSFYFDIIIVVNT